MACVILSLFFLFVNRLNDITECLALLYTVVLVGIISQCQCIIASLYIVKKILLILNTDDVALTLLGWHTDDEGAFIQHLGLFVNRWECGKCVKKHEGIKENKVKTRRSDSYVDLWECRKRVKIKGVNQRLNAYPWTKVHMRTRARILSNEGEWWGHDSRPEP